MKKVNLISLIAASAIVFFSCQKATEITKKTQVDSEVVSDEIDLNTEIVFKKSYDGSLSLEEMQALWEKDIQSLNLRSLKAGAKTWVHSIFLKTGTGYNDGTVGQVDCQLRYETNYGSRTRSFTVNKNDNNLNVLGQWNNYLITSGAGSNELYWVKLKYLKVTVPGNDGWGNDVIQVADAPLFQDLEYWWTGASYIQDYEDDFLKNGDSFTADANVWGKLEYEYSPIVE